MLGPPAWLSNRSIEEIAFHSDEFTTLHDEFVDAMGEQEMALDGTNVHTELMCASWASGSYWYTRALDSPTALLALYINNIQPRFGNLTAAHGRSSAVRSCGCGTWTACDSFQPRFKSRSSTPINSGRCFPRPHAKNDA